MIFRLIMFHWNFFKQRFGDIICILWKAPIIRALFSDFREVTVAQSSHYPTLGCLHHPRKLHLTDLQFFLLFPPAPGNHWSALLYRFAFSRVSHKWNYTTCGIFCLASFTWHIFKFHLCCLYVKSLFYIANY